MWWMIFFAALIIIGYFVYNRKSTAVQMSKEQIKLMQDLIAEDLERIKTKKQEIIDQGAKEGKTISLAPLLEHLEKSKTANQGNKAYITEIDRMKKDLVGKYGTHIPVDEAYKLMQECENENE